MGKLVNSRLFRYQLFNKKENVYADKLEYASLMMKLKNVDDIVGGFFFKEKSLKDLGLIFHSIELLKEKDVYELKIYLYDTNFEEYLKEYRKLNKSEEKGILKEKNFMPYLILMNKRLLYLERIIIKGLSSYLKEEIKVLFYGIRNIDIDAYYVAKYLCTKLKQGYSLNELLREVEWGLKNFKFLKGFKISCYGRFDRKTRAHKYKKVYGSVPFSSISKNIDYGREEVILKFGLYSVNVWLHFEKEKSSTYSYKYKL